MISKDFPLIVEKHPENYKGYEFITLIHYGDKKYLNIVDNVNKKHISTYVLDLCVVNNVDEQKVIDIAYEWYINENKQYPISIEFSKLGMSEEMNKIMKLFSIEFITRVIGPLPQYEMNDTIKIRKRKRKKIPSNMEFSINKLKR
jgi:hypothetical protein